MICQLIDLTFPMNFLNQMFQIHILIINFFDFNFGREILE